MTEVAAKPRAARSRARRKETPVAPAPAMPLRDNIADSRRLIAELNARPKNAPISALGRELEAIRQKYIEEGGKFVESEEEFQRMVRSYRFGIED